MFSSRKIFLIEDWFDYAMVTANLKYTKKKQQKKKTKKQSKHKNKIKMQLQQQQRHQCIIHGIRESYKTRHFH